MFYTCLTSQLSHQFSSLSFAGGLTCQWTARNYRPAIRASGKFAPVQSKFYNFRKWKNTAVNKSQREKSLYIRVFNFFPPSFLVNNNNKLKTYFDNIYNVPLFDIEKSRDRENGEEENKFETKTKKKLPNNKKLFGRRFKKLKIKKKQFRSAILLLTSFFLNYFSSR